MAKSLPPYWPAGFVPWLAVLGSIACGLVAFVPSSRELGPLAWTYQMGLLAFRSEAGVRLVAALAFLAHALEGAYALAVCARAGLNARHASGWLGLTLLMGYPALSALEAGLAGGAGRDTRDAGAGAGSSSSAAVRGRPKRA